MPYRVNDTRQGRSARQAHGPKAGAVRQADLRDMAAVAAVGDAMRMNELRRRVLSLKAGQGRGAPGFAPSGQPGGLQRGRGCGRSARACPCGAHACSPCRPPCSRAAEAARPRPLREPRHQDGRQPGAAKAPRPREVGPARLADRPGQPRRRIDGKHSFSVTATLAPEGLAALAQNAPPGLAGTIAGSPPGRYMYLVDRGRVTDFGPRLSRPRLTAAGTAAGQTLSRAARDGQRTLSALHDRLAAAG